MEEKCFLCDDIATESIGNKFICTSCIQKMYHLLKDDIERDTKNEIEHNGEIIKVVEKISIELSRIKHDISELKRRIR